MLNVAPGLILTPTGITGMYPAGGGIAGLKKTSLTGMFIAKAGSPGPIHPVVGIGLFRRIRVPLGIDPKSHWKYILRNGED